MPAGRRLYWPSMIEQQPFYLFFGLLGLVIGGVVVWLMLAQHPFESSHESPPGPVDEAEAPWLVRQMAERGRETDEETVVELLKAHSAYVGLKTLDELYDAEVARLEARQAHEPMNEDPQA